MCLILFAWRPGHDLPLLVAANRDEFHARPSLPLAHWDDAPGVYAGRDLEAGGTWMGIGPNGRFAALTNIRDPSQPIGRRSRGELVAGFLHGEHSPTTYLAAVAAHASEYSGFNLLVGNAEHLYYLSARQPQPRELAPGVYGLCNAALDTPWPKLLRARQALVERLEGTSTECLLELLADSTPAEDAQLPSTGIGLETERLLSSIFIRSAHYGTRTSSALIVRRDGRREFHERRFGPHGARLGEVKLNV